MSAGWVEATETLAEVGCMTLEVGLEEEEGDEEEEEDLEELGE